MATRSDVYINQLPDDVISQISVDVMLHFVNEGYLLGKCKELRDEALNGRLCDLEEILDVSKYL